MNRPPHLLLTLLTLILMFGGGWIAAGFAQVVILVPDDFPTIQEAISASSDGDVVEVSPGTYVERLFFEGKAITVIGVAGAAETTIDAGGCSGCTTVTFDQGEGPDTVLDGFTITGGRGTPAGTGTVGGGLYFLFLGTGPTIRNCHITENSATQGGGAYASNSSPRWQDCTFSNNVAAGFSFQGGGALYSTGSSTLIRCRFIENSAGDPGGAIYLRESGIELIDCTFVSNSATTSGGSGGAIYSGPGAGTSLIGCTFFDNSASSSGGAIACSGSPIALAVVGTSFFGNTAGEGGGAIYNFSTPLDFANCVFSGNQAASLGGAIHNQSSDASEFLNCTFYGNMAPTASAFRMQSQSRVSNSIIWGNGPNAIEGGVILTFSCFDSISPPTGSISTDPLFVDPTGVDGVVGTMDDDLSLSSTSPCIDIGDPSLTGALPFTDIVGNPRVQCSGVDMGAYESILCSEVFIRGDANGDLVLDVVDPVVNLEYLFLSGPAACLDALDSNDDGEINVSDPVALLLYLFGAGPVLPTPFPDCGQDLTADPLRCSNPSPCP